MVYPPKSDPTNLPPKTNQPLRPLEIHSNHGWRGCARGFVGSKTQQTEINWAPVLTQPVPCSVGKPIPKQVNGYPLIHLSWVGGSETSKAYSHQFMQHRLRTEHACVVFPWPQRSITHHKSIPRSSRPWTGYMWTLHLINIRYMNNVQLAYFHHTKCNTYRP